MTQAERVLDYLKRNNSITTMDAWVELGVSRLSAVIFELKRSKCILKINEKVTNRYGETCTVARYYLIKE
jgi:hypothetical protein